MHDVRSPRRTLLLVMIPMLATFIGQRFYLHLIPIQHLVVGGYLIHHLFLGLLIALPAAFVLAFGFRNRLLAIAAPLLLGVGTAMVLDEAVYLVAMEATFIDPEKTGPFYRTSVSLWGAIILVSIGAGLLLFLYCLASRSARKP
ncbi:MAG TPA: hypothetical protein VKE94_12965 [Gemmataceae bacterium]|nr:hypothetical protein [Gemmataceae bacterium]